MKLNVDLLYLIVIGYLLFGKLKYLVFVLFELVWKKVLVFSVIKGNEKVVDSIIFSFFLFIFIFFYCY